MAPERLIEDLGTLLVPAMIFVATDFVVDLVQSFTAPHRARLTESEQ